MLQRVASLGAALALVVFVGVAVAADKAADKDTNTHSGIVVTAVDGKLTMTDKDGKNEHSHRVAADAVITCNGKECKLDDLKKGETVTVTTRKDKDGDSVVAVKIEAASPDKNKEDK